MIQRGLAAPAPAAGVPAREDATAAIEETATEEAAAQARAQAQAMPEQTAAAAAVPPAPAGPGGPDEREDPDEPERERPGWRARRHRRLHRLRIGHHAAPEEALDRLQLTSNAFGLLLGWSQAGRPVAVPVFTPDPRHVVLVGGAWAAELITFRSLGFGARTVVFTDNAPGWIDLGYRATGRSDRVAVLAPGAPVSMVASADAPVLRLGGADPSAAAELPAWTTRLSVLSEVTPDWTGLVAAADIVLTQRLSPAEATALAPIRQLPAKTSYALQVLHDDMLAVLTAAGAQYAWVNATSAELDLLGPPRRY